MKKKKQKPAVGITVSNEARCQQLDFFTLICSKLVEVTVGNTGGSVGNTGKVASMCR